MDPLAKQSQGRMGCRAILLCRRMAAHYFCRALAALAVGRFERDAAQHRSVKAKIGQLARRERLQLCQRLTIDAVGPPCGDDVFADFGQARAEAHAVGDRAVARYICHFHHFLAWAGQRRIALWLRW